MTADAHDLPESLNAAVRRMNGLNEYGLVTGTRTVAGIPADTFSGLTADDWWLAVKHGLLPRPSVDEYVRTLGTVIPADDTLPQNSEGYEVIRESIMPSAYGPNVSPDRIAKNERIFFIRQGPVTIEHSTARCLFHCNDCISFIAQRGNCIYSGFKMIPFYGLCSPQSGFFYFPVRWLSRYPA